MQKILQQVNKKSGITKLKALQELQQVLGTLDSADFFQVFIPTFVYLYRSHLSTCNDKRVLLALNRILLDLVARPVSKSALGQKFKDLFPSWFIQMHDTILPEVA